MPTVSFAHRDQSVSGFPAPQPTVVLILPDATSKTGVREVPFVFDTGAAITLVPVRLARDHRVSFSDRLADREDSPRTLLGPLAGYSGVLRARLLGIDLALPCFVYESDPPTPDATGRPLRTVRPPHVDSNDPNWTDAWAERQEQHRAGRVVGRGRCVLGRLGFLSRFHVRLHPDGTTISTAPFPDPRPWWKLW